MEEVYFNGMIKNIMMVNFMKIKLKVMVFIIGKMEVIIKVIG